LSGAARPAPLTALPLRTGRVAIIFLAFASGYFLSALLRAVTATLAPLFSAELQLQAGDLGLLAGAYFLGFALTQLPLGAALDRFGPKRVLLAMMSLGAVGCVAFALATDFSSLVASRMLIGVGVSASLMSPLMAYRLLFSPAAQLRANSWMLMAGSLGMLASTLPVQAVLAWTTWRGLFLGIAAALALAMLWLLAVVPTDASVRAGAPHPRTPSAIGNAPEATERPPPGSPGYLGVFGHPVFVAYAPMALINYGGMIAIQALWAGPWLTQVCGWTAHQAAQGLFLINLSMLCAFLAWGVLIPRLQSRGWTTPVLVGWGLPWSLLVLVAAVVAGPAATAWVWALYCVACTFVSLTQPSVAQAFPAALTGRALTAYNLLIFAGVFLVQWGVGLVVDALQARGWSRLASFQGAFALFALCSLAAYLWFLLAWRRWQRSPASGAGQKPQQG
jgi:MFS family permease